MEQRHTRPRRRTRTAELIRTLRRRVTELEEESQTDYMTGCLNRRAGRSWLSRRRGRPLTVFMVDVDHFKHLNDTQGHPAGDAALRQLSAVLREAVRGCDRVCRWGGEEFLVLCPDAAVEDAETLAERIRRTVETTTNVTVSVGIAGTYSLDDEDGLIRSADVALYSAKKSGRNRVVTAA